MQTFSKIAGEYLVEVEAGKTDLISLLKRLSEKELPLSHDGFTNFLVWLRYKLLEITEVEVGEGGNFTSLKTYGLDIKDEVLQIRKLDYIFQNTYKDHLYNIKIRTKRAITQN